MACEVAVGRGRRRARRPCACARSRPGAPRRPPATRSSLACMPRLISPISSRKSVPPWATSKSPARGAVGAGERAAHVTEQRRLEQPLGDGAAVLADERPGRRAARSRGSRARRAPCRCRTRRRRAPAPPWRSRDRRPAACCAWPRSRPTMLVVRETRARGLAHCAELALGDVERGLASRQVFGELRARAGAPRGAPQEDLRARVGDGHRGERRDHAHPGELARTEGAAPHAIVEVDDAERLAAGDQRDGEHAAQLERVDAAVDSRQVARRVDRDDGLAQLERALGQRLRQGSAARREIARARGCARRAARACRRARARGAGRARRPSRAPARPPPAPANLGAARARSTSGRWPRARGSAAVRAPARSWPSARRPRAACAPNRRKRAGRGAEGSAAVLA